MKVRLAKKIITCQCRYWKDRRIDYGLCLLHPHVKVLKKDHRFMKANIVTKWRYAKVGGKHGKKIL